MNNEKLRVNEDFLLKSTKNQPELLIIHYSLLINRKGGILC